MKPGSGKSKGSAFERSCCVALSLWVSGGKQEDCYWRSSMSGGRSTVAARRGTRLAAQAGDISCIHPVGAPLTDKFYLECKAYRDLKFVGLLKGKGHLVEFWAETVIQARNYGKLPMLIAKQNQQPTVVCLSQMGHIDLPGSPVLVAPKLDMFILLFEELLQRDLVSYLGFTSN